MFLLFLSGMQQGALNINDASQHELIAALKANNESVMKELYAAHYKRVEVFVLQNSGTASQAKDIYQEAFVAVWRNVRNDKFTPQSEGSLGGYLYQVAKYKWIDYLRSAYNRKTIPEEGLRLVQQWDDAEDEAIELEKEYQQIIADAFEKLGKNCKNMLDQFYFKRKSHNEIAEEFGLKEASVRNQKYRCMQKLKKLVQKT